MRKLFMFNMVSLDGFFEGPGREIDWHTVDGEFNDFALQQLAEVDTLVFGRVTYELMAGYWPTAEARKNDPLVAGKMNSLAKLVFSRSREKVEWENCRLVKGDPAREISKLKTQPGKDMALMGSADLGARLIQAGSIDELRIMVNPVILGAGRPLFTGMQDRRRLALLSTRTFHSGNVLLTYRWQAQG